jgi:hypothetical protein
LPRPSPPPRVAWCLTAYAQTARRAHHPYGELRLDGVLRALGRGTASTDTRRGEGRGVEQPRPCFLALFTRVLRRRILGSPYPESWIAPLLTGQDRLTRPPLLDRGYPHIVVVDRYAPGLIAHAVSSRREHMGWRTEIRERIAELEQKRLRLETERRRARRVGGPEGERLEADLRAKVQEISTTSTTSELLWSSSARGEGRAGRMGRTAALRNGSQDELPRRPICGTSPS